MKPEYIDVIVVGAGLSGVGAGYNLQTRCPSRSYAIFEGRSEMGGTWSLFQYPGIRSDSDMHTLGYSFRPWMGERAITDGESILHYIEDTAAEYGIDQRIRYNHRVTRVSWSSDDALWTVDATVNAAGQTAQFTCSFLFMCTGYYDYAQGYTPQWRDTDRFTGTVVHPQHWPADLDTEGRRIVVIGSGATAVTLVPALAESAEHVTMLQRSPTYIVSRPSRDGVAAWLHRLLPSGVAHTIARWKSILLQMYSYNFAQRFPQTTRRAIVKMVSDELGPDYDVEKDFTPSYNPWDQRLCLVPDSDLFDVMKSGKASIVTDRIESFSEHGIRLQSGDTLDADIIVTATGLNVRIMSGIEVIVDGREIRQGKTMTYKGMMSSDVPNLAMALGYTNASWTLKCELISEYVCRLINYMDEHGYDQCTPRLDRPDMEEMAAIGLTSGYIRRALDDLPRQGTKRPWKIYQNYFLDLSLYRFGRIDDGTMKFTRRPAHPTSQPSSQQERAVAG